MSTQSVLIVEDEPEIADLIRFHLEREGLSTRIVGSGRTALEAIEEQMPDLVLLDLMLPDLDGLEVCRRLKWREATRDLPVVIVSAKGEESDIVAGIELGADDYVTKPFSPRVLLARVKNVLRRGRAATGGRSGPGAGAGADADGGRLVLAGGAVVIDSERHSVRAADRVVELTVTEFGILAYLAARPGFVRTREQIISAVHGENMILSSRTVDVHVTALRRKLGAFGRLIETVRGIGYRLTEDPEALG